MVTTTEASAIHEGNWHSIGCQLGVPQRDESYTYGICCQRFLRKCKLAPQLTAYMHHQPLSATRVLFHSVDKATKNGTPPRVAFRSAHKT